MTIIQPNREKKFFYRMTLLFGVPLLGGVLWLVVLYNQTVNVRHNIDSLEATFQEIEARNAELKDSFFALFKSENLEVLANRRGLIKEKNPEYIEIHSQWASASQ